MGVEKIKGQDSKCEVDAKATIPIEYLERIKNESLGYAKICGTDEKLRVLVSKSFYEGGKFGFLYRDVFVKSLIEEIGSLRNEVESCKRECESKNKEIDRINRLLK